MAKQRLVLLWVLAALSATLGAQRPVADGSAQDRPTFRTGVRTVAIYATVNDAAGRLVPDLDRSAFRLLDNGRPVDVTVFSNDTQPITAAIMLDMSNSMVTRVRRVRESIERFVDAMAVGDRARIGTFGMEVAVSPLLTGDKNVLKRVLREELWPRGPTPLWRALLTGMASLEPETGRRVVLVLTDGNDADPLERWPSAKDVKRRAVAGEFMVYAIGLDREQGSSGGVTGTASDGSRLYPSGWMYSGGLSGEIVDVVEETGGGHVELKRGADLGETFVRIAEELRRQYLLGFTPRSFDGKTHRLEVQVARPGCKVRARKGYVAREER